MGLDRQDWTVLSWEAGQWPLWVTAICPRGRVHWVQGSPSLLVHFDPSSLEADTTWTPGEVGGSSLLGRGLDWPPLLDLPFGRQLGGHISTAPPAPPHPQSEAGKFPLWLLYSLSQA